MNGWRSFFVLWTISAAAFAMTVLPVFAQTASTTDPNAGVAAAVQSYFVDIPVMIAIATCESGPRQFAADGAPLYAGTDDEMVGVFQIDSSIHTAPALALGFDITTLAGNMGYARYLYGAEGTDPWISSFPCWSYAVTPAAAASSSATIILPSASSTATSTTAVPLLTANLSLGEIGPQVLILQQLLNQAGYTLASSGPGSPGNETTKFGALTYAALKKFQRAEGIACSGDEATTGYGYLNAPTRTALLAAVATTITPSAAPVAIASPSSTQTSSAAEVASLESRVAALVVIVQQLEAELAARM
jgi:hypothetical protein